MKKTAFSRLISLLLVLCLFVGLFPPMQVSAAGDALSEKEARALFNSVTLHPQRTGYLEMDALLEGILKPVKNADTYTKLKTMYDWTVRNITYSWEGYSKQKAPAYEYFTLTYPLTYEEGLQEAIPREMIDRSYHSLTAHKGVCYDYAALFAIMARYIGIDSFVHTGLFELEPGHGSGLCHHGWAELVINGKNYIFDPQRENRFSSNGTGTIKNYYFGISYENAWRYTQNKAENAARDAGLLPVGAHRALYRTVQVVSSRSGFVTGAGAYDVGTMVALEASGAPFSGWYRADGTLLSAEREYSFEISGNVTVYALFEGDYFCDIPQDAWYLEDVMEAAQRDIVHGTTPILFQQELPLTRAMAVQLLANVSGADLSAVGECPFTDVPSGSWYEAAATWAWENEVVLGVSSDQLVFAPDQRITRQDMVTILVRYLEKQGISLEEEELDYTDQEKISPYALGNLKKAQGIDLIRGYTDGSFRPLNSVTRAEGVTILMRMVRYLDEYVPEEPSEPEEPTEPIEPIEPIEPEDPTNPSEP